MKSVALASSLFLLGLVGSLVGCSSTIDTDADSESELRKKPKANENWSSLTVQLPTGSCQPGGSCSRPLGATATILLDGTAVALGAANRIKPGAHTVTVNGASTTVTLAAGGKKTLVLPTARRKCQAANLPNVAQTDFGASVTLANAACPSSAALKTNGTVVKPNITLHTYNWGCPAANVTGSFNASTTTSSCSSIRTDRVYSVNVDGRCLDLRLTRPDGQHGINPAEACSAYVAGDMSWLNAGSSAKVTQLLDYDLAFVPGDYTVAIGTGSSATTKDFTLKEGNTAEIDLALPVIGAVPATFSTKISFGDPAELTNAAFATITSSCSGDRSYTLPAKDAVTSTTTLNLKAFTASSCVYTFSAGGRTVALSQSSANNIQLQRLDVDHPEITREDGSTYLVNGTYELFFGGTRVAGPFSTPSGVDLLPGTYELVTSFTTVDGAQTQRETINL